MIEHDEEGRTCVNVDERRKTAVEQHIGTVGIVIIMGIGGWGLNAIVNQGNQQQKQQAESLRLVTEVKGTMNVITTEVTHLREMFTSATSDRYTGTQAASDRRVCSDRVSRLEVRVNRIENNGDINK